MSNPAQEQHHQAAEGQETSGFRSCEFGRAGYSGRLALQLFEVHQRSEGVNIIHGLVSLTDRRIGVDREPTVVANVKATQKQHFRPSDAAATLRIRLLGPVTISNGDEPLSIPSRKARALLGYLALRQGIQISRDALTGLLWGDRSETQARASLRQTLSELRTALAGSLAQPLVANRETISWLPGSAWIDAQIVESAANSENEALLRDAAELVGGELMEGLSIDEPAFEQWLSMERERFRLLAGRLYSRLQEQSEHGGRLEEALTYGLKLLSVDPLQEHVHRTLMRLYAAQGRHDAALGQYERCRRELSKQLGVSPEPETDNLARSIRANRAEPIKSLAPPGPVQETRHYERSALTDRTSIAVLPFANMSSDAEHEFFVDGLTEDLITALSRISRFLVISHASTSTYKGTATNLKEVASELGVRYVMEGSVRRAGERLRVTAQLIDAATGHHIWAERYDRSLIDLFDIQDEITRSVAASTQTQVDLAERHAVEANPSLNFEARDLVARARGRIYDQTPEAVAEATELIEEAIKVDPSYPRAHLVRAQVLLNRIWVLHDMPDAKRAFELAKYALQLNPRDEYAHLHMAWAWAYVAGRLDEAIAECERGLEINPNCSLIFGNLGVYLAALGKSQEAIKACQSALQLNPRDPSNFWRHYGIAVAHFAAAEYPASLEESKRVARSRPHLPSAIIWAASAAALDKTDEAKIAVEDCLTQRPDLRVASLSPNFMLRFVRDEDHDRLLELLQKAGLPA